MSQRRIMIRSKEEEARPTYLLGVGVTNKYTGTWNTATKKAREKFIAAMAPKRTENRINAPHLSMWWFLEFTSPESVSREYLDKGKREMKSVLDTLETRSTDTRLIRTPVYNWHFRLSRPTAHSFYLNPLITDNDIPILPISRVTNCHISSAPLYRHCLSKHCPWLNVLLEKIRQERRMTF